MNKVAILIDGGYFLKRLPSVRSDVVPDDVESVIRSIRQLVHKHLQRISDERLRGKDTENLESPYNLLHRCFYYDARPYKKKHHTVKLKQAIDYAKSKEAVFRENLFRALTKERSFALRLGRVQLDHPWLLKKRHKNSSWTERKALTIYRMMISLWDLSKRGLICVLAWTSLT